MNKYNFSIERYFFVKKIISLLLMLALLVSCTAVMSACNSNDGGDVGGETPGGETPGNGENPGGVENPDSNDDNIPENGDDNNNNDNNNNGGDNNGGDNSGDNGSGDNGSGDNTGDTPDTPTTPVYKLVGITLNVDEFAQQSSKLSLKLQAKTETTVYVILSENTSSFGLQVTLYPGSEQLTYELTDLTYNETLGAYVTSITVPEMSSGDTFEANLVVNGSVVNERFRVSIPKVTYIDPNGSNPV